MRESGQRAARVIGLALLGSLTIGAPKLAGQPTMNLLSRVLMVQSGRRRGTIFSIDVNRREYWITAKHILTGAERPPYGTIRAKSVRLRILNPGAQGQRWVPEVFSLLDTGPDIDVVVLAAPRPILIEPLPSMAAGSQGVILGGPCEFLGFPFGGGWRAKFEGTGSFWLPFVKHCTVSGGTFGTKGGIKVWVLDGINNPGFSGGPVVFGNGSDQKVFAVVSGYVTEPAEVVREVRHGHGPVGHNQGEATAQPKEMAIVNSGFILAYDIKYALDAIKRHPIGPQIPTRK